MRITVREAAVLLGVTPRTVRARIRRGELSAVREGHAWMVDRRALPLGATQRRAQQARAQQVRAVVDAALPSRMAATADRRARSLADLDAFRALAAVIAEIRAAPERPGVAVALPLLEGCAGAIGESSFVFERERKLAALSEARALLGRAVGALLVEGGDDPAGPVAEWVIALEQVVQVTLGGYARWVAGLGRGR